MDLLKNLTGIGGAGCREVTIDPSRVQRDEFEAAAEWVNVLWSPEGLVANLGPTWYMVHDPRFLAIERMWAREDNGMLGGTVRRGVSVIQALDLHSTIKVVEDPQLYSEMLAEGRHFLSVCSASGIDVDSTRNPQVAESLVRLECPNYVRRDGSLNNEAHDLIHMMVLGLLPLVRDYARQAYSLDWVRMDTGEVVHQGEVIWDPEQEMQIPIIAVEVDTIHKALIMRAQVRTTAMRLMRDFPGMSDKDFESVRLTDSESDLLCRLLFSVGYDKIYTILPQVMSLINAAVDYPYEDRESRELQCCVKKTSDFAERMASGEIEAILTPIEDNPEARPDPSMVLGQISRNPYLHEVFQALQNSAERGSDEAQDLLVRLMDSGGTNTMWSDVDAYLLNRGAHPKQNVFEAREILSISEANRLRMALAELDVDDPTTDESRFLTATEIDRAMEVRSYVGSTPVEYLAKAVLRRGVEAPTQELVALVNNLKWDSRTKGVVTHQETYSSGEITAVQVKTTDMFCLDIIRPKA